MGVISYRNRSKGKVDKNGRARRPSWEYRFQSASIMGKRTYFSKAGFSTKQEAIEAGTKAYNEYMSTGTVFKEVCMSYSDVLDSWMRNYVRTRCAPSTVESYESLVRLHIRPVFGRYRLLSIRHETVQCFINEMFDRGFSRNTLVNVLGILSCSMRYAKRQHWIQFNPAEDIDLPSTRACVNQRQKQREPIPREVIQKILERFPEGTSAHLAIILAYRCGLRLGEAFGLTWDDVDLENGFIVVNRQSQWRDGQGYWQLIPPKYNSCRRISLDQGTLELLKRTRKRQLEQREYYGELYTHNYVSREGKLNQHGDGEETEFVMIREDGTYIQARVIAHASKVIKRDLGYDKFDYHSLRHTHATELSEYGVNLKEIQRRLGHKTMDVTCRTYVHATDSMESESMMIMNRMYDTTK